MCLFWYTVEKLLSVCSSSCLPGGGSNTELALHCLHHCRGDTVVIRTAFNPSSVLFLMSLFPLISPPSLTASLQASVSTCAFSSLTVIHSDPFSFLYACLFSLFSTFTIPLSCAGHTGDAALLSAFTSRRLPLLW